MNTLRHAIGISGVLCILACMFFGSFAIAVICIVLGFSLTILSDRVLDTPTANGE